MKLIVVEHIEVGVFLAPLATVLRNLALLKTY